MKSLSVLSLFMIISVAAAADMISVDEFKRLGRAERLKAIEGAPPEQREELGRINVHLKLLSMYGGEEGVRRKREELVTAARGFSSLELLFATQVNYLESYELGEERIYQKGGVTGDKLTAAMLELENKVETLVKREKFTVHSLAFSLAPSPEALEFETKVEALNKRLDRELNQIVSVPGRYVTKSQLMAVDEQVDRVFGELKALPKLSADEVQREFDAYPEEKILREVHLSN
jgi:hypothetical protein